MRTTIGSLFAGCGGLDLALGMLGPARTAWVADIEPGPRTVLAHRYPDSPNLGNGVVPQQAAHALSILAGWAAMDGTAPEETDELGTPDMLASLLAGRLL